MLEELLGRMPLLERMTSSGAKDAPSPLVYFGHRDTVMAQSSYRVERRRSKQER